jgi:hypothetical protein
MRYSPMRKPGSNAKYIDNMIKDDKLKIRAFKRKQINVDKAVDELWNIINT